MEDNFYNEMIDKNLIHYIRFMLDRTIQSRTEGIRKFLKLFELSYNKYNQKNATMRNFYTLK